MTETARTNQWRQLARRCESHLQGLREEEPDVSPGLFPGEPWKVADRREELWGESIGESAELLRRRLREGQWPEHAPSEGFWAGERLRWGRSVATKFANAVERSDSPLCVPLWRKPASIDGAVEWLCIDLYETGPRWPQHWHQAFADEFLG